MYAHQIIASLEEIGRANDDLNITSSMLVSEIKHCHQFYLEITDPLVDLLNKGIGEQILFDGKNLPYKHTLLCESAAPHSGGSQAIKAAILMTQEKKDSPIEMIFFTYHNNESLWTFTPLRFVAKDGGFEFTPLGEFGELWLNEAKKEYGDYERFVEEENYSEIVTALLFLDLLECKNIVTENILPPAKLNKKRQKKGKQPLLSYKTLVIKPTGKQQKSIPKHLWENRVHLCRGHFKTYTADAPLFGKYTGRYWWQPSVRGRNKKGVVVKDYHVEAS